MKYNIRAFVALITFRIGLDIDSNEAVSEG